MARKKKVENLNQIHAKEEKFIPTTLDQIWGDTGLSKYKTLNEDEYKNSLDEMNKTDLHAHACYVGLVPVDNREMLTKRLLTEFRKHAASFRGMPVGNPKVNQKISKEVEQILSEGR